MSKYRLLNDKKNSILEDFLAWLKLGLCILKREVIWLDKVPKGADKFFDVLAALGVSKEKFDKYFEKVGNKSIPNLLSKIDITFEEISAAIRKSHSASEAVVKIWEKRRKFISVEEAVITLILLQQEIEYETDQRKGWQRARKILEGIFGNIPNIEEEIPKRPPRQENSYIS